MDILQKVDRLPLRPEYIKCGFTEITFSLSFVFTLLLIAYWTINYYKMENLAFKYRKYQLCLPCSVSRVIPGVCWPSISLILKQCKLADILISSDLLIQELALHAAGSFFVLLQIDGANQEILSQARAQLAGIPTTRKLYTACRRLAISNETKFCQRKLNPLTLQFKFEQSTTLEVKSLLWNQLLLEFHRICVVSFIRELATLPTSLAHANWSYLLLASRQDLPVTMC